MALASLFACNNPQDTPEKAKPLPEEPGEEKPSRYNNLLSKFKDKSFDTLRVFSPEGSATEYNGIALDSADVALFPRDIAQQHFDDPPGLYAVYKFPVAENRLGLIARTPAMYAPTSIKFFLFDKERDSITAYTELAEVWGDAGDYMLKDSWLFREGNAVKSFMWLLEGHDNSVEGEGDTTVVERTYYYLLDLSRPPLDTVSKNERALEKRFGHLVKHRNVYER